MEIGFLKSFYNYTILKADKLGMGRVLCYMRQSTISHAIFMLDLGVQTSDHQLSDPCICHVWKLLRRGALVKIQQVKLWTGVNIRAVIVTLHLLQAMDIDCIIHLNLAGLAFGFYFFPSSKGLICWEKWSYSQAVSNESYYYYYYGKKGSFNQLRMRHFNWLQERQ